MIYPCEGVVEPRIGTRSLPERWEFYTGRSPKTEFPTKQNLAQKGVVLVDDLCPLCKEWPESRDHLFINCKLAIEVCTEIKKWWNVMMINGNSLDDSYSRLFNQNDDNRKKAIKDVMWHAYLWSMWKGRNAMIFSNEAFSPRQVATSIQRIAFLWLQNRSSFGKSLKWEDWCCNKTPL